MQAVKKILPIPKNLKIKKIFFNKKHFIIDIIV